MSDTADVPGADQPVDPDMHLMRERKLAPIVPTASIASSALTLVIAIMTYLASLTLGAVTIIGDTARGWQSDIAREITIQVRPVEGVDLAQSVLEASRIAEGFEGVTGVTVIGEEVMKDLLEPWLGSGLDLEELPVPQLLTVAIDDDDPPDLETLRRKLIENVAGASMDDHRAWLDRLVAMAQTTVVAGFLIFLLMMASTVLTVIFATRGAMSGNAHIIEVLHFVGAERRFIAGEFQHHFMMLGLRGSAAGGVLALLTFVVFAIWIWWRGNDPSAEQAATFFGSFSMSLTGYIGTILLIFAIAALTAVTSRFTVLRFLGTLDRNSDEIEG
ncbi:MAG: ABC transporter permease [Ahrensia sp.]|nr:ABC transporter permease [Ahrensia sp.]